MSTNRNNKNRTYQIKNSHAGFEVTLTTALPQAKRAKVLTLKTKNKTLQLNGRQINVLKTVFVKENAINS